MTQPTDQNWWLAWILPVIAICGVLWAIIARVFNTVTRTELVESIKAQDAKFIAAQQAIKEEFEKALEQHRLERVRIAEEQKAQVAGMHGDNKTVNTAIFAQLRDQDKAIARIEGALSGRYQTLDPHQR